MQVSAQLDVLDAKYLDAAIEQIAALLPGADPTAAGVSKAELRARALGALAHPAYALALQQQAAAQPTLTRRGRPRSHRGPGSGRGAPPPTPCRLHRAHLRHHHHALEKLRPVTQVFVHIPAASLAGLDGPARVEGAGSLTQDMLPASSSTTSRWWSALVIDLAGETWPRIPTAPATGSARR